LARAVGGSLDMSYGDMLCRELSFVKDFARLMEGMVRLLSVTIVVVVLAAQSKTPAGQFLTPEGQTMVIVPGGEFVMGAPPGEPGRTDAETPHRVRIPRSFAVATTELTVAQFARFLAARPEFGDTWRKAAYARFKEPFKYTPTSDSPQTSVSWYDAARYCNWLSERDEIPRSQWVYPDDARDGMVLPADYLHRTGYRLLTEAEWEFAARAGTTTAWAFGDSRELLPQFAWFDENSNRERTRPVGTLKPNAWGLFDMYGNVWEWTFDRRQPYPTSGVTVDVEDAMLRVSDDMPRTRRGGSFTYEWFTTRAAHRGDVTYLPAQIRDSVGFRVGRTMRWAP